LVGHTDIVNTVRFYQTPSSLLIISGSVDKSIRIWRSDLTPTAADRKFQCIEVLESHQSTVNCIAATPGVDIFATGSADATVKIWKVVNDKAQLLQTIKVAPRFFPLALTLSPLKEALGSVILAVAGTAAIVQLYVADSTAGEASDFKLQATLSGHEGWIRSLAFTHGSDSPDSDLLLSSASQDKYTRLWRVHQGGELPAAAAAGSDPKLGAFLPGKSLSNKAHRFSAQGKAYSATFEALLLGHDDWIYSTAWRPGGGTLQLLSASADNSLTIWEQDTTSGIWVSVTRLGEISVLKGSTTATGSTGGFWTGLWSPSGETVVCLGRTGSWRQWNYNIGQDRWIQGVGISGHVLAVTGIAWSRRGDYLLSTSSDQTTRLHAKWTRGSGATWHEMARPQIHGYDLNCIDTLGESQFVSGADEKLLRVFKEPKAVAELLQKLCGIKSSDDPDMPDAANMPVLGLSNKAVDAIADGEEPEAINGTDLDAVDPASIMHKSTLNLPHPPLEDHLSRHTLWPEIEKLYGHGYEISALACSHDGALIATACKASSLEHAVIRIFETRDWHEIRPPLAAHSLTVTRLRFSGDDACLLSVGRDRQWAVFARDARAPPGDGKDNAIFGLAEANLRGHARMILDAAWAPGAGRAFATAGRDKVAKLWGQGDGKGGFACRSTIPEESPVTAVDFTGVLSEGGEAYLAVGTEAGRLTVYRVNVKDMVVSQKFAIEPR
jgi:elongator complex protein 2